MTPFYGLGSISSRLQSQYEESLLLTTKSAETPGTHLINLRRMARPSWSHLVLNPRPLNWESSALPTGPSYAFHHEKANRKSFFLKKRKVLLLFIEISPATTKKLQHFLLE